MPAWMKSNAITIVCTTVLVLGLYAMGAGVHAGWGFVLLLNLCWPN